MKTKVVVLASLLFSVVSFAQVSIGNAVPNPSANLDVTAIDIDGNTRGLLIPRINLVNTTDAVTINNGNVNSLLVFNEATQADVTPGFYYWFVDKWERVSTGNSGGAETNTVLTFDPTSNQLLYSNEQGNNPIIDLSSLSNVPETNTFLTFDPATGLLSYSNEAGNNPPIDLSSLATGSETNTNLTFDPATGLLTYVNEEGDNPALDLSALKIEPWQVETTTNQASLNTQNIYQMGNVGIGTNDMLDGTSLDARGSVRFGTGNTGAVGVNSITSGTNNTVSGNNSAAVGVDNVVLGSVSGAVGSNNIVNVNNAMAIGLNNVVNAEQSFTVGNGNVVSGTLASAMGRENITDGEVAVAHGVSNQSLADYSYTMGVGNIAGAMGSMVFGRYNALTTGNPTSYSVPLDPYFQLGNGTGPANRSNIITVLKNGKTGFGNMNTPQATIHVITTGTDITPAIIEGCNVYADNAAATAAGVPVGGLYRTATGVLMVRF